MTIKDGSEGREKYRSRTITNTLEPVWSETAVVAMPDVNGLLLLVRKIWLELDSAVFYLLFFIQFRFYIDLELVMFINVGNIFQGDKRSLQVITQENKRTLNK